MLEEVREAGARELSQVSKFEGTHEVAKDSVEAACKYMNYLDRQLKEMENWRRNQDLR